MNAPVWLDILLVWLGGSFGALTRFGVQHLHIFDDDKYYYTIGINLTGCLTIGILWALFTHFNVARLWYLFLITGFLGGYTTYSAFTLDAILLFQNGRWLTMIFYILITVFGGLGGCALGFFATEKLLKMI